MESNFASPVPNCTPQALDAFKRAHAQAINNLNKANDHVRAANEGKQKLVDSEKKAKSNLSAEKKKTAQLSKEVKSLKGQLTKEKNKNNKCKKGGSKDDTEADEGQEVARMQEEIDGLQGELDKANGDIRDLRQKLQDNEGKLASKQKNLEDTVAQLSVLKARNVLHGLEAGEAPTLDEEKQALEQEVSELKKQVKELKVENISLNKQLNEATSAGKKNSRRISMLT